MKRDYVVKVKPVADLCNLKCKDCSRCITYEADLAKKYVMSSEMVDELVVKSLAYCNGGNLRFEFEGGEPLLASLTYFKYFVGCVEENNLNGTKVSYQIVTNATVLTQEHCQFFKDYNFEVGVNSDGCKQVHNIMCRDRFGRPTFGLLQKGIKLLMQNGIEFFAVCKVNKTTLKFLKKSYEFYKKIGATRLDLRLSLMNDWDNPQSEKYALNAQEYFDFHRQLLDLYLDDKKRGSKISIKYFDDLIARVKGEKVKCACGGEGYCECQWTVDGDGSMYPCSFYMDKDRLLGNVMDVDLEKMYANEVMQKFVSASYKHHGDCFDCSVFDLCKGGCRRFCDRDGDNRLEKNVYCDGIKKFLEYLQTAVL